VTIPDNTPLAPASPFVKTWRVKNSGTCDWGDGFQLVFASGEQMGGPASVPVSAVAAGATIDVSVNLAASSDPGTHKGVWRVRSKDGTAFGSNLTVVIVVSAPSSSPSPACSGTPIIESFVGSPTTITAGNSATLSWGAVTNAEAVEIDNGIGGVGTPGSTSVSPPATTTYTMVARCGADIATRQVTIVVNPAGPPPPQAPTAPGSFNAVGTGTTIQFTWTDNSTNEVGFRIYQAGVVAPVVSVGAHTGTGGMSYNWTGRPCNTSATFLVKAYNSAGESNPSSTKAAVTIPCAPTSFNAVGVSQTQVNVALTDNATNETGFRVYRSGSSTALATLSARSGTGSKTGVIGSIPCGMEYTYYARAYNSAGESVSSNSNTGTTSGCTVVVNFTSVHIYDDEDPSGSGELHFDFNVNGIILRWPSSGTVSASSGSTKAISGVSVTRALLRSQSLSITVKGTDHDTPPFDADDSLGTATATYTSASTWGKGSRCIDSASPKDFRICYTISVTP
jgi:hypothetical protein